MTIKSPVHFAKPEPPLSANSLFAKPPLRIEFLPPCLLQLFRIFWLNYRVFSWSLVLIRKSLLLVFLLSFFTVLPRRSPQWRSRTLFYPEIKDYPFPDPSSPPHSTFFLHSSRDARFFEEIFVVHLFFYGFSKIFSWFSPLFVFLWFFSCAPLKGILKFAYRTFYPPLFANL